MVPEAVLSGAHGMFTTLAKAQGKRRRKIEIESMKYTWHEES